MSKLDSKNYENEESKETEKDYDLQKGDTQSKIKRFSWSHVFCCCSKKYGRHEYLEDIKKRFRVIYVDYEAKKTA